MKIFQIAGISIFTGFSHRKCYNSIVRSIDSAETGREPRGKAATLSACTRIP